MLDMLGSTVRGLASELEFRDFEKRHSMRFSKEHREFLATEVNGGCPITVLAIPTLSCHGGAGQLDGFYGVNHPIEILDMGFALPRVHSMDPNLTPFGFDNLGGLLLVEQAGKPGRLVYVPWEEQENIPLVTYHVADSIAEFLEEASKLTVKYFFESLGEGT